MKRQHQISVSDPDKIRNYILDMVDQLAGVASNHGEELLGAMLSEVAKRQRRLECPPPAQSSARQ